MVILAPLARLRDCLQFKLKLISGHVAKQIVRSSDGLNFLHLEDCFAAKCPQRVIETTNGSSVPWIKHPAHYFIIHAKTLSECNARQTARPKRQRQGRLSRCLCGNGNEKLAGKWFAWHWYCFVVVDTSGDRLLERVFAFGQCL